MCSLAIPPTYLILVRVVILGVCSFFRFIVYIVVISRFVLFCSSYHGPLLQNRVLFQDNCLTHFFSWYFLSFACILLLRVCILNDLLRSLFPPCPYYFRFKSVLIICQYSRGYSLELGSVGRGTIPWQQFYFSQRTISLFSYNRHAEQRRGLPPPSTVRLSDRLFSIVR